MNVVWSLPDLMPLQKRIRLKDTLWLKYQGIAYEEEECKDRKDQ